MFTSTMTDEELRHEALLDFLEIKTKLQIALQDFSQMIKRQDLLHSIVQNKTCRTRRRNTWNVQFYIKSRTLNRLIYGFLIYLPLRRGEHVYYLFQKGIDEFLFEIVTPHLVQRYKERYIEPNHIDLGKTPLAVYFLRHTMDMRQTNFTPHNWTEEEARIKQVWISDQGLIVSEEKGDMRTFITFLDQENLTQYKALVYEEASLIRKYRQLQKCDNQDSELLFNLSDALFSTPNATEIFERYLRRTTDPSLPDYKIRVREGVKLWIYIQEMFQNLKKLKTKKTICDNRKRNLVMSPEILEKIQKTVYETSQLPVSLKNDF